MRALLDTHAVLWAAEGDARLGTSAAELLRTLKTGEAVISDITLLEIVSILEGPICVVDCVGTPEKCDRSGACVTRGVWGKIENGIKESMAQITLKELVDQQTEAESGSG